MIQTAKSSIEASIALAERHGYRIEGDEVHINAELLLHPRRTNGSYALELWAAPQSLTALSSREPSGTCIAELPLVLPRPLATLLHYVEGRVAARLPLHGASYFMQIALVQMGANGERQLLEVVEYPAPERFVAPHFEGSVGYRVEGAEVVLDAHAVFNPRSVDNLSGSLSIELWALQGSVDSAAGHCLASAALAPIAGQQRVIATQAKVPFTPPAVGSHRVAMLLREWTQANGYVTRDRRDFELRYEVAAPAAPSSAATAVTQTPAIARQPAVERKASPLSKTEAPKAAAPVTVAVAKANPGLVSIQTATAAELARVPGVSERLAKSIVAARPYRSINDLLRISGIGSKMLAKLKQYLTL